MIPYTLYPNAVTFLLDGGAYTYGDNHPHYPKMLEALRQDDEELLRSLLYTNATLGKGVKIRDGEILVEGEPIPQQEADFILSLHRQELDIQPYLNFVEKRAQNPSFRSRRQLWDFISKWGIYLYPDGDIRFYKRIAENWTDCRSGKFNNSLGAVVEMDRTKVDDDPAHACSSGLHVAHPKYLNWFNGPRTIAVKVNPRDIVSIPHDHDLAKIRVCRYEVVEEVDESKLIYENTVHEEDMPDPFGGDENYYTKDPDERDM